MDNVVSLFRQKQSSKRSHEREKGWIGQAFIYEEAIVRMGNDEARLRNAVRRGAVRRFWQGSPFIIHDTARTLMLDISDLQKKLALISRGLPCYSRFQFTKDLVGTSCMSCSYMPLIQEAWRCLSSQWPLQVCWTN